MQQNTEKGNSTLRLKNGSSIEVSNFDTGTPDVTLDPISGEFTIDKSGDGDSGVKMVAGRGMGKSYSGSMRIEFTYQETDYQKQFEEKRQGMHDIVADGDGLTREMVHDLVLTANKAVWQQSKKSDK